MREMPLPDVATRLGLELDRHDKHKWRGEGQIISINNQKFYDHVCQKGGYGAIDLVMHVQRQNFKQAVDWLSNGATYIPPTLARSSQQKHKQERQPFQLPTPDQSKWAAVRQYLTEKRQLPPALVDELHHQGKIYADSKHNAVFVRQSVDGMPSGASLRGTYKDSQFKGLATGSRRDGGWFSFTQGKGQLERIVLVESSIDAMSAAALSKSLNGSTMFIATDGAGAVPIDFLRQHQAAGVQVNAAHDADRAGEEMAWKIALEIPAVTRATPNQSKDWNEQLLGKEPPPPNPTEWKRVAQALGKSEAYINKVITVTEAIKIGQPLPENASTAMQQDFSAYKQLSRELWQWHQATKALGKSEKYLHKIASVAIAFHHPTQSVPLSEKAITAMEKDLWLHYSQNADPTRTMKAATYVAIAAIKDGRSTGRILKILEHDPELPKIRQRAGVQAAHNHIKNAFRSAEYTMQQNKQSNQHEKQQNQSRKPGLQL